MGQKSKIKLERCPLCGGKVTMSRGLSEWHFWCKNDNCATHISFPFTDDILCFEDDAIKKFNTRYLKGDTE